MINKYVVFAFSIILFIVGIGVGFYLTPEYASMQSAKSSGMKELGNADKYIDLRYMDNMIAHHLSAIDMLSQALQKSKRSEIQSLAKTVIQADTEGITQLYAYKKEFYNNTRKITQYSTVQLGEGDDLFDLRLINALITHHDEAIASAMEIRTKSTRTQILTLADAVIQTLSANKEQLKTWRKTWYDINSL